MATSEEVVAAAPEAAALEAGLKHKLERKWTFWCDNQSKPKQGAAWGTSLRKVYTFDTVEEFWCLYDQVFKPSKLQINADFHLFKTGIEPKWEDPECANGGKWSVTSNSGRKANLDNMWLETMMALIGEQFEDAEDICGVVASVRQWQDKLSLWTKTAANEAAQHIATLSKASTQDTILTLPIKCATPHPQVLYSRALMSVDRSGSGYYGKKRERMKQCLYSLVMRELIHGPWSVTFEKMSIGRKWKEIIDVNDKITYNFHDDSRTKGASKGRYTV
ncbi:Eukaryotic translation initiation factor isoform 4E-2 [Glycine max]|nr:Eukaryotic translation initiation factor isoform 4E-2 [Glycine max]